MTPIPSADNWDGRDSWEARLASAVGDYGSLAARPWQEVRALEFLPNVHVGSALYEIPEDWLPHGFLRRLSSRVIDPTIDVPWDESLRRTLFALALPRRTLTGIRRYKPTSWLHCARKILRMARWSVANQPSSEGLLWAHLTIYDWRQMFAELSGSDSVQESLATIVRMLEDLGRRGVISDSPAHAVEEGIRLASQNEDLLETARRGQNIVSRKQNSDPTNFQPLPDTFVTAIISRAFWLQENLAGQLLDCWVELLKAAEKAAALGRRQSHPRTTKERRDIIQRVSWMESSGAPLTQLPWAISVKERGSSTITNMWPPKDPVGITMMVTTLQALNFCCVALCTGARSSEILSATDGSISDSDTEGRLHARTFKLIDQFHGVDRDWPLHPVAVRALKIQQRIAEIVRANGDDHLWVLVSNGKEPAGSPMRNATEPLVQAAEKLGLGNDTGGIRPHAHRWRQTVARLIALAVTSAPQVLLDLFGHRDLEMTLKYMLADPQIAQEVRRIAAEVSYAIAAEALSDVEAGAASGPAAAALERGIDDLKMRRGEEEFDAASMREVIEILTFGQRDWNLVRPGVLCTKSRGQFGPCTMARGIPDPGGCRTSCQHRLETARAKSHCERTLDSLIAEHAAAVAQHQEMIVASLEGQILANLLRWDDVRERFLAQEPSARDIWEARSVA